MYKIKHKKIISTRGGDVRHGLRVDDEEFVGFGEVYFTEIQRGFVKGWKRHKEMQLNLLPVVGAIRLLLKTEFDEAPVELIFGEADYKLIVVNPMVWVAFEGLSDRNIMANVATLPHDPEEADIQTYEGAE